MHYAVIVLLLCNVSWLVISLLMVNAAVFVFFCVYLVILHMCYIVVTRWGWTWWD